MLPDRVASCSLEAQAGHKSSENCYQIQWLIRIRVQAGETGTLLAIPVGTALLACTIAALIHEG